MSSLEQALTLANSGRYTAALTALNGSRTPAACKSSAEVLRLELLERTEGRAHLRGAVARLLASKLVPEERCRCEVVLARMDRENGDTESGIRRLQRAAAVASEITDQHPMLHASCLVLLTLFVAQSSGPEATAPLIASLRKAVTRAGSAQLWAALHMCVAQIDARRGLLRNVPKHTKIARSLLASDPNLSTETHLHIVDFGAAIMSCDFSVALSHARRAVDRAEESGCVTLQRNCFGNLSYALYQLGDFDGAASALSRALAIFPSAGNNHAAVLETGARLRLAQGDVVGCSKLLDEIAQLVRSPEDKKSYAYRGAVRGCPFGC